MKAPTYPARNLMELKADFHLLAEAGHAGHALVPLGLMDLVLKATKVENHVVLRAPMGTGKTQPSISQLTMKMTKGLILPPMTTLTALSGFSRWKISSD